METEEALTRDLWGFEMIKMLCVLSALCCILNVCCKDASLSGSTDDKIGKETTQAAPWPDRMAPDFSALDMDGRVLPLSSYRGKVVLLNLWATWCYPCVLEIPALERIYRKYGGEDFEIVAVSLDQMETEQLKQFLKGRNITFTILHDQSSKAMQLYYARAIPTSFLIDRNGTIVKRIEGLHDWEGESFQDELRLVLEKI